MNYRILLPRIPITITLVFCASLAAYGDNTTPINLIPMYGYPKIEKTDMQKEADEQFIKTVVTNSGSREKASKEFAAEAWREKQKGNVQNSMRYFNQSWLLNPNYYQPYWGFGSLLLSEGEPDIAVTHFEKALTLIDEEGEKPRLLTDTAKAYSTLGGDITTTTDKAKSEKFFIKSNSLFEEALRLDPQYGNAYRAWAISLLNQSNYKKAWEMVKKSRGLGGRDFDPKFIGALSREMPEPK
jgi:tetratricopeptide (TPR) repeat protein